MLKPRPRWDTYAAWMFSYTVRRGKMLVRWNDRPMPRRQRSWGAMPVTSRSLNTTRTAMKPPKFLESPRTSSTGGPPREAVPERDHRAGQSAREDEEQDDQDAAQDQRPVLGVGDDLLVEPDEGHRAHRRAVEGAHAAQQGHDQHLGRLGPVREVREDAAIEDPEEPAGQPREGAREDEGGQFVEPHVHPDELGALRVLPDGGEHAPEGRGHDALQEPQAERDQDQAGEVVIVRRAIAPQEGHRRDDPVEPVEARVGDLGHALLATGHLVPLEADGPDDLGEREGQHREVDAGEAHAEEPEDEGAEAGHAIRNETPACFMRSPVA